MATRTDPRTRAKAAVALVLTVCSGIVDLVGFLGVQHVFTAHLTGTTVQVGRHIAAGDWHGVGLGMTVIVAYVAGSILGRAAIEICARHHVRRVASFTLALEAVLVACVAHVAARGRDDVAAAYPMLAALAAAMGLQTATLTRVGPLTIHTTFITGMINKLAQLLTHILFRLRDRWRTSGPESEDARREASRDARQAALLALLWPCYVLGAVIGAFGFRRWAMTTLYAAVVLLLIPIAADRFWGLAIQEEREQSER